MCIYILLNIAARWLFIALSFIYIRGILYIFIYILSRLMFTFLLKLKVLDIFIIIWDSLRIFYDKGVGFYASVELLRGFYMACVCFVYVCDVRHLDKRVLCMILAGGGRDSGQGYPLPLPGQSDG